MFKTFKSKKPETLDETTSEGIWGPIRVVLLISCFSFLFVKFPEIIGDRFDIFIFSLVAWAFLYIIVNIILQIFWKNTLTDAQ